MADDNLRVWHMNDLCLIVISISCVIRIAITLLSVAFAALMPVAVSTIVRTLMRTVLQLRGHIGLLLMDTLANRVVILG